MCLGVSWRIPLSALIFLNIRHTVGWRVSERVRWTVRLWVQGSSHARIRHLDSYLINTIILANFSPRLGRKNVNTAQSGSALLHRSCVWYWDTHWPPWPWCSWRCSQGRQLSWDAASLGDVPYYRSWAGLGAWDNETLPSDAFQHYYYGMLHWQICYAVDIKIL